MAYNSNIDQTDATWNPWMGCIKVSDGCKFCYMYRDHDRYGMDPKNIRRSKTTFDQPRKWKDPLFIFTCSWSDFFIEQADEWRPEAWKIIQETHWHLYQIYTKRPEWILERVPRVNGKPYLPPNVILICSVENNNELLRRWPFMEELKRTYGWAVGMSIEPLLEPIRLEHWLKKTETQVVPDWVIVGGESGNDEGQWRYRRCSPNWITEIVEACKRNDIPVFVKQMGTYIEKEFGYKKLNSWPKELQSREMPGIWERWDTVKTLFH